MSTQVRAPELPEVGAENAVALKSFTIANPVLVDVRRAHDVVPGMTGSTILTSGAPMAWGDYTGGQRTAIMGAAIYEGLAASLEEADFAIHAGDIQVAGCHDYSVVGSLAGVTSPSMPVLVVEDPVSGGRGFCSLFEGETPSRLNYGVWDDDVARNLDVLAHTIGPALGAAVRGVEGGIPLLPIMKRALHQGDELHSRNTAASLLFLREIAPRLVELDSDVAGSLISYLTAGDYFFLRPAMAASKVMADRMHGVGGSSIVTAMAFSCREFAIRVSGLGQTWFRGPLPHAEASHVFDGFTVGDMEFMGGESIITEVCGLGGFAQAAAPTLQAYQGGVEAMRSRTLQMYEITDMESPHFTIPSLGYRGSPTGINVEKVVATGITPVMDIGIAGRGGGQIGAGAFRAPLEPFLEAQKALGTTRSAHA